MDKKEDKKTRINISEKSAALIVRSRYFIFLLFALASVYCVLSIGKVRVNSDFRVFLPKDSETRRGIAAMSGEFASFASATVMIEDISFDEANELAGKIKEVSHVFDVSFDDTEAHYKDSAALFSISFDGKEDSDGIPEAMDEIRELVQPYDEYIRTDIGFNYSKLLSEEMTGVMAIAVIVVVLVLLLTSRSYFEIIIFGIVFAFAALLNMGTNFWLGEISSITNSVAIILQLALAIDYAIIFAHHYQDAAAESADGREALVSSLAHSIVEISSSSLTTISGLIALTLMRFGLGRDLGSVLAKSIICSMLTVFLLMPGLIYVFAKPLKKTVHKKLIPDLSGFWAKIGKIGIAFIVVFAIILPFAFWASGKVEYAFNDNFVTEIIPAEDRTILHKIEDKFGSSTAVAILVPVGDYDRQRELMVDAKAIPDISSGTGLAEITLLPGVYLTDSFSAESVAKMLGIEKEQAELLFKGYALEHFDFGDVSEKKYPLVDLMMYLFDKIDSGVVELDKNQTKMLDAFRPQLERGVSQLHGTKYDRLVFTSPLPAQGDESFELIDELRKVTRQYYDDDDFIITGDITSTRDLLTSYKSDSLLISLLTVAFVFIILLFTFRNPVTAAVMVFVIQGSIWINFSFMFLGDIHASFVTHMIVSAIQMGATIDYAIVFMSRYLGFRGQMEKKEAAAAALNACFPTVFTSGSILTAAGFIIAYRVTDVYIGHIGLAVGRGALTSIILVLTVLPQLTMLLDRFIYGKAKDRKDA